MNLIFYFQFPILLINLNTVMKVKIDTKEKFHIITINEQVVAANMTAELKNILIDLENSPVKNVIVDFSEVVSFDEIAAEELVSLQQDFYDKETSFVICCINSEMEKFLDDLQLLEFMNVTRTQSEAWDIVQMEEVERELLNEDNEV